MIEIEIKDGYVIDLSENTLVKRVATAISVADCKYQDTPGTPIMGWSETLARAAISAMVDWKIENKPRIIADSEFSHVEPGIG